MPLAPGLGVATNTLAQLAAHGAMSVASVITLGLISRAIGPAGFGQYSLAFAYAGVLSGVLANWGLGPISVREASQQPAQAHTILVSAAAAQLVLSTAAFALLLIAARSLVGGSLGLTMAVAGAPMLFLPVDILAGALRVQLQFPRLALVGVVGASATLLATIAALAAGAGIIGFAAAATVAAGVRALVLLAALSRLGGRSALYAIPACARRLLRESLPLAAATTLVTLTEQAPLLLLGRLTAPAQVGYFSGTNRLAMSLMALPVLLASSAYPAFSHLARADRLALGALAGGLIRRTAMLAVAVCLTGLTLGRPLVLHLFGPDYGVATPVLDLLFLQLVLLFPGVLTGEILIALGRQRSNVLVVLAELAVIVVAGAPLTSAHGALGAATATLLSYGVGSVLSGFILLRTLDLRQSLRLPALALSTLIALLVGLGARWLGLGAASPILALLVYTPCLWRFGALSMEDLALVNTLIRRFRGGRTMEVIEA